MSKRRETNYFNALFYKKEYAKLLGYKKNNLLILTSILFVSYFALSFLQSYTNKLKLEMDNPYTNWVSLDIPNHKVLDAQQIIEDFQEQELLQSFSLDTVSYYNIQHIEGLNELTQESLGKLRIRSINTHSALLQRIIEEHKIQITQDELENDCWVIINSKIYGTDKKRKDQLFLSIVEDKYINVPIIGELPQLPDNCDVLVSEHLMSILQLRCESDQFRSLTKTNNHKVLIRDTVDIKELTNSFEKASGKDVIYSDLKKKRINQFNYHWLTLSIDDFYDADEFLAFVRNENLLPVIDFQCNSYKRCEIEDPYYLTFNFNSLDKVSLLQNHLKTEYGFSISLHDVKSKENFAKVAQMAMSTSFIIIILSLSSIMLFLYHILESHISKIKKSIGTLKAFGLSNEMIIRSYSVICGKLFIYSSFIALLLLFLIQIITYQTSWNILSVYSTMILTTWLLSFIAIFIFCGKILRHMLNKTPGDLIYKR